MPRVDFQLADRVYLLKLICTAQMTYSSFLTILYLYLFLLEIWTSTRDVRPDIPEYKWSVVAISVIDFGMGTLLAFAANMRGLKCRRRIVIWIILESVFIPISIFLLTRLYYKIKSAQKHLMDPHYTRTNLAQVCFICCHFFFIAYVLDFLVENKKKPKIYDPSIRPESVYAPTDPQITTTESRHIRMSHSFLFQPSTSKRLSATPSREELGEHSKEHQSEHSMPTTNSQQTHK